MSLSGSSLDAKRDTCFFLLADPTNKTVLVPVSYNENMALLPVTLTLGKIVYDVSVPLTYFVAQ